MPAESSFDNDVLIKLSAHQLLNEALQAVGAEHPVGAIGAARFVVPHAITEHLRINDKDRATAVWDEVAPALEFLEPTDAEVLLAASIEEAGASHGLDMDVGESQLCAIAISRGTGYIVTGDKRAIAAVEVLGGITSLLDYLVQRIVCLEQVIARLVSDYGSDYVRERVCAESGVDRSCAICLGCAGVQSGTPYDPSGLESYIESVRTAARRFLWPNGAFP